MFIKMYLLEGTTKHYQWGKQGPNSAVARISKLQGLEVDKTKTTFSEFWWGTHPQGMSKIKSNKLEPGSPLGNFFANGDLSFLLKVLSIEKCLSLQIHPDRTAAELLHRKELERCKNSNLKLNYPDPYDKPELVVALNDFGGFSGFEDWEKILANFGRYMALEKALGGLLTELDQEPIKSQAKKSLFEEIVSRDIKEIGEWVNGIREQLTTALSKGELDTRDAVTLELINQYQVDVGVILTLMLRYVELKPLEGMLLTPNVPHCYFKGEVIEIMHSSNNVIRLGLTPKFKDQQNLLKCIDYGHPKLQILNEMSDLSKVTKEKILSYSTSFDPYFKLNIIGDFNNSADVLSNICEQENADNLESEEFELLEYELTTQNLVLLNLGGDVEIQLICEGKDPLVQEVIILKSNIDMIG